MGEDELKNRYFEDKTEWYGRDRWVEYIDDRNPDSSKITPQWHAWLHHNTDASPTITPLPEPSYKTPAMGNPTGTSNAYVPSHHRLHKRTEGPAAEKFEAWNPHAPHQRSSSRPQPDVFDLK